MHWLGKLFPYDASYDRNLVKELGANAGCHLLQVGPPTSILRHQAIEGLSHVEEQTIEEIHDKVLNIPKPVADDGSCRKDELA